MFTFYKRTIRKTDGFFMTKINQVRNLSTTKEFTLK